MQFSYYNIWGMPPRGDWVCFGVQFLGRVGLMWHQQLKALNVFFQYKNGGETWGVS